MNVKTTDDITYWQRELIEYHVMASSFGKLDEFDPESGEDWVQYVERMDYYFLANKITKSYKLLRNLITPKAPSDKSFKELVEAMMKRFCPPPSEIVQRFKFNMCVRKPGESVANYIAELQALSQNCNFKDTLELMLRDRIVFGINDVQTQKQLLVEKDLSFAKAKEIALGLESAVQSARDIQIPSSGTVQVVEKKTTSHTKCFRCGRTNHAAPQCRYKDAICKKCNKIGHLAKVCQSKKTIPTPTLSLTAKKQLPTHVVSEQPSPDDKHEYALFTIQDTKGVIDKPDPLYVGVNLNGKQVSMELGTGSAVSIMSESKFKEISSNPLQESQVNLYTYSGEKNSVQGEAMCNVEYEGKQDELPIIIISGNGPILLGRSWLKHISLNWPKLFQPILKVDDQLTQLLESFGDVFKDELGTLQGDKVSIHIDSTVGPYLTL